MTPRAFPRSMYIATRCSVALLLAVAASSIVGAQQPLGDQLSRLDWRSVGPINNAGRVSVVTGVPGDPLTYYVSGANGGIGGGGGGVWARSSFSAASR